MPLGTRSPYLHHCITVPHFSCCCAKRFVQKLSLLCVPHAGSGVVRIDLFSFLARWHTRQLNQALSVLSVGISFFMCILLFIRNGFVLTLVCVFMYSVSWLLLVKLSVLAKWLVRKTPLRMPNRGEGIVSTKPRLKSVYDFLVYCIVSLFYDVLVLSICWPYVTYFILYFYSMM